MATLNLLTAEETFAMSEDDCARRPQGFFFAAPSMPGSESPRFCKANS